MCTDAVTVDGTVGVASCEQPERVAAGHDAELDVDDVVSELASVERTYRAGARVIRQHIGQQHSGQHARVGVGVRTFGVER